MIIGEGGIIEMPLIESNTMSEPSPEIKMHGIHECESCRRDYDSKRTAWICPRCGYDNIPRSDVKEDEPDAHEAAVEKFLQGDMDDLLIE
jgi:predicted RNA-binding Zn-ribbon protein involved in translation (DUF1610 family)